MNHPAPWLGSAFTPKIRVKMRQGARVTSSGGWAGNYVSCETLDSVLKATLAEGEGAEQGRRDVIRSTNEWRC